MKRTLNHCLICLMLFTLVGSLSMATVKLKRMDFRKVKFRMIDPAKLHLPKADFVVRNVKINVNANCDAESVMTVEAEVWNIGDADYNAFVKVANILWDYSDAATNKPLWWGEEWLPSIPKGQSIQVTHGLSRNMVQEDWKGLLKSSRVYKVSIVPNILEDYVPEKDFKNNISNTKASNPCYRILKPVSIIRKKK